MIQFYFTHTHAHIYIYTSLGLLYCKQSHQGSPYIFNTHILYIYIYIIFQILFHYRLLQYIEYSFLCYTEGPWCLYISCTVVCVSSNLKLLIYPSPPPLFPFSHHKLVFYVCEHLKYFNSNPLPLDLCYSYIFYFYILLTSKVLIFLNL